jgi:drug/metabolite transporter (DMT)-like permease
LFSSYFLHEHLGFFRIFGMVLIITGILFASRG